MLKTGIVAICLSLDLSTSTSYLFIKTAHLRTVALWDLLSLVAAAE